MPRIVFLQRESHTGFFLIVLIIIFILVFVIGLCLLTLIFLLPRSESFFFALNLSITYGDKFKDFKQRSNVVGSKFGSIYESIDYNRTRIVVGGQRPGNSDDEVSSPSGQQSF